jgi:predicted RNA-binding protein YlxR (DUF448 family)
MKKKEAQASSGSSAPAPGPIRTCVGCGVKKNPRDLFRVTLAGEVVLIGERGGRGAWICKDSEKCVELALKRGRLAKALRRPDLAAVINATLRAWSCHQGNG